MEQLRPDDLEAILVEAPVAYVPLGTYEHHGWHLPVGFDGVKASALCRRVVERTGGVVLPAFWYGIGGGHVGYKWTVIVDEEQVRPVLALTLDHLARFGFRVVVLLTGHYAGEQVRMVHALADEAAARHPGVTFIGLTEPEISTPLPGDRAAGDHAAKYETSIGLALDTDWVRLDRLTPGRDPAQVALPDTPRAGPGHQWDPVHRLYAIWGQDPGVHASREIGEQLVTEIVDRLAARVETALGRG
jgi:creatinine amidohydrolase